MVVTGAGPGIMAAGLEGAGRANAFGVNIRLPFEQGANAFIAKDPKLVEMKYFFTRKLMLIKESNGFVVLPGGFGTLDEAFELLDAAANGQGRAVAGCVPRHARRHVLAWVGGLCPQPRRLRGMGIARRQVVLVAHRFGSRSDAGDSRLLLQLPLARVTSEATSCCVCDGYRQTRSSPT